MPDKKLTPEQLQQLNNNAAKMQDAGYSADEIKEMASQYFEKFASVEGEPVNFTNGSQEPQEQPTSTSSQQGPSEPSGQSGTPEKDKPTDNLMAVYGKYTANNFELDQALKEKAHFEDADFITQAVIDKEIDKNNARILELKANQSVYTEKLLKPVKEEFKKLTYGEDGKVKSDFVATNYYGIKTPDLDKIKEYADAKIDDENLRRVFIKNTQATIQASLDNFDEIFNKNLDVAYEEQSRPTPFIGRDNYVTPVKSIKGVLEEKAKKAYAENYVPLLQERITASNSSIDSLKADVEPMVIQQIGALQAAAEKANEEYLTETQAILNTPAYTPEEVKLSNIKLESLYKNHVQKVGDYIAKSQEIENNYNSRLNNHAAKLEREYQEYASAINQKFNEEYKLDPETKRTLDAASKIAAERTQNEINTNKKADLQEGDVTDFNLIRPITSFASSLSGMINDKAVMAGSVDGVTLDKIEQFFQPNVSPIKGFEDLSIYSLQESTGSLMGSMMPSVIAGLGTAAVTRNLGTTARVVTAGMSQFLTVSYDNMASSYREVYDETGSVEKATNAAKEVWEGQLKIAPAYVLTGLKFTNALNKLGTPARVVAGGAIELVGETVEETLESAIQAQVSETGSQEGFTSQITPESIEETFVNVLPTGVMGMFGAGSAPANKIYKAPDLAVQHLYNVIEKEGKGAANLEIATLYNRGKISEDVFKKLSNYIDNHETGNSKSYNAIMAKKDMVAESIELEKDPVKQKILKEQVKAYEELMERVLLGEEGLTSEVEVDGEKYNVITNDPRRLIMLLNEGKKPDTATAKEQAAGEVPVQPEAKVEQEVTQEVSDYIDNLVSETEEEVFGGKKVVDSTLEKMDSTEYVNDTEIDNSIEAVFNEIDRVNNLDISDKAKKNITDKLYNLAEQLDNYEFRTKTETVKVTEAKATLVPIESPTRKVQTEQFYKNTAAEIDGEVVKLSTDNGRVEAKTSKGTVVIDTPSLDLKEEGVELDENGTFKSATFVDRFGTEVKFTGDTGLDLAIKARENRIGTVPSAMFEALYEEVSRDVEVETPYIKGSKKTSEASVQSEAKVGGKVDEKVQAEPQVPTEEGREKVAPKTAKEKLKERSRKQTILKQIDNAKKAIARVAKGVEIIVATTPEHFEILGGDKGAYVNGKIYINLDKADFTTVAHEVFHGLLLHKGMSDAKARRLTENMLNTIRKTASQDLLARLDEFASMYDEGLQSEESMAQLFGIIAESYAEMDGGAKSAVRQWLDGLIKALGLEGMFPKDMSPLTASDKEVLNFLNTVARKVATGEEVTDQDVAVLEEQEGDRVFVNPTRRAQKAAIEILDGPKFDNKLKEDVASYLNSLRDSEIPPNSSREQLMERFINNVYEEVGYYLFSKPDARSAGLTWYIEDMVEFENKVKVILPELSNEKQYKLFLSILAFTSSGTNPNHNLSYAYNLWNNSNDPKNFEFSKNWGDKKLSFVDKKGKAVASGVITKETAREYTVELVDSLGRPEVDSKGNKKYEKVSKASMKPGYPKSTGYTNRGKIIVGQLEKLEKLYADLKSIDAVVEWLETPHPIAELRKYNEAVPDVNGKGPGKTNKKYDPSKNADGERNGAFIFGEKIGSFYQNMIGIGETITMDLWWSRTWNRYMGTMINTTSGNKEIQEVPRSDRERNIMREAVKMVAEDLNLQVSELQAAIWYFEQELWTKSGNASPSYSYVTAIDELTEKLKVDEETRTKLRAAEADLTEAEKRRKNAAERAAAVVASKGGEIPKVEVKTRAQRDAKWEQEAKDNLPDSNIKSKFLFEDKIKSGKWAMLTGENPNAKPATEEENKKFNEDAVKWLKKLDKNPIPIFGKYGGAENSFFVENLRSDDAAAFAREFKQESVATNEGLILPNGDRYPRLKGEEEFNSEEDDYYSVINIKGEKIPFKVGYDVENLETALPEKIKEKLTDDGKGNYVFYHYSSEKRDVLKPFAGDAARNFTSKEEASALSSVGGVVMFYTDPNTKEAGVGNVKHTITIPKDKVYYFQTDRAGLYLKAKELFNEARPNQAFSPNYQAAWISKIMDEAGYEILVSDWKDGKLRAQTTKEVIVDESARNKAREEKAKQTPRKQKPSIQEMIDFAKEEGISKKDLREFLKEEGYSDAAIKEALPRPQVRPPSARRVLGQPKPKKVTVQEMAALKDQIRLEARAARGAVSFINKIRRDIQLAIEGLQKIGKLSTKQVNSITNKLNKVNLLNPIMRERFIDYMEKVYNNAEYAAKLSQARATRAKVKKKIKSEGTDAVLGSAAKAFAKVDPSMVDDIDAYNEVADKVLSGLSSSRVGGSLRSAFDIDSVLGYANKKIEEQNKAILNKLKETFEEITGIDPKDMTYAEMMSLLEVAEDDNALDAKNKQVRTVADKYFDLYSTIVSSMISEKVDPFTGEDIEVDSYQAGLMKRLMSLDRNNLTTKELVQAVDILNNFVVNGKVGGVEKIVMGKEGLQSAQDLKGTKSTAFKFLLGEAVGRFKIEKIAALPFLFEKKFGGFRAGQRIMQAMGLQDLINSTSDVTKATDTLLIKYYDKFGKTEPNGEVFNSIFNNFERGIYATLKRTVNGTEQEKVDEFNRKKSFIEEAIKKLALGTEQEKLQSEKLQEAYTKIVEGSNNISDVESKMNETNKDAVGYWIDANKQIKPELDRVSLSMYNSILEDDLFYTSDTYKSVKGINDEITDEVSGFSAITGNRVVAPGKAGQLKQVNRPKVLNDRYLSLDFDTNMANAYSAALMDIATAPHISKIKGFMNSKEGKALFGSQEDYKVIVDRVQGYINAKRGKSRFSGSDTAKLLDLVSKVGSARALASITQPVKQTVPVAIGAMFMTSPTNFFSAVQLLLSDKGANKFIDESGYGIAVRGASARSSIESLDKQVDKLLTRTNGNVGKAFDILSGEKLLENVLVKPDVAVARASWLAFYKQDLKKQGVKTGDIDWNTHKLNKGAANYAQGMVDRSQNVSDSDLQGTYFTDQATSMKFIRAMFPFMTFILNQKERMYSDIAVISSKTSAQEDKVIALKSLVALMSEIASFGAIKISISVGMFSLAAALLGYDEPEEEKEKRLNNLYKGYYTNLFSDITSPFPPVTDSGIMPLVNLISNKIEGEDLVFEPRDKGVIDMIGTAGILANSAIELKEVLDKAYDGKYTKESFGKEVEKSLTGEQQDAAKIAALLKVMYVLGAPTELNITAKNVEKIVDKQANKKEDSSGGSVLKRTKIKFKKPTLKLKKITLKR